MELVPTAKNTALDALTIDRLSLHDDIPDATGSNEVTGGSPAYARKTIAVAAASAGARAMSTSNPEFDVPAGTDAVAVGFWDDNGGSPIFHGWSYAKGSDVRGTARALNSGDVLQCFAHGLSNGNRVQLKSIFGQAIPAGLSASLLYFVVGANTDDFQVSLTLGGSAVAITADGEVGFVRAIVESFVDQGVFRVTSASLDLNG